MPSNFHAVKRAAEQDILQRFGLQKTSGPLLASAARVLRSGAAGGLVGGALGGVKGFIEGGAPKEDGTPATFRDRLRSAGASAAGYAGAGAVAGGMSGGYGLNRQGLKTMFSASRKPGVMNFIPEMVRENIFGSPVTAYKRYNKLLSRAGGSHLKTLGSELKNFYWRPSKTIGGKIVQALPILDAGYNLYSAAKTDDPNERRGAIASAASGLLAAPVTSRLGLAGAVLHPWLQHQARNLVQKSAPAYNPTYNPVQHAVFTAKSMGSYGNMPDVAGADLDFDIPT